MSKKIFGQLRDKAKKMRLLKPGEMELLQATEAAVFTENTEEYCERTMKHLTGEESQEEQRLQVFARLRMFALKTKQLLVEVEEEGDEEIYGVYDRLIAMAAFAVGEMYFCCVIALVYAPRDDKPVCIVAYFF